MLSEVLDLVVLMGVLEHLQEELHNQDCCGGNHIWLQVAVAAAAHTPALVVLVPPMAAPAVAAVAVLMVVLHHRAAPAVLAELLSDIQR